MRLAVLCCLAGFLLAVQAVCPSSTGSTLWSAVHGGVAAGADVTISGDVWLDVSTPALGTITIPAGSGLYFSFNQALGPLVLNASNILVYGSLCVGSPTARFPGDATISLWGEPAPGNQGTDGFGVKVIGVAAGATFGLYGEVKTPWTRLSATALRDYYTNRGPTSINIGDDVNWRVDDTIIVGTTDFPNSQQTERRIITAISGRTLSLSSYLRYTHYGEIYTAGGGGDDFVDMRAEVGALNRNVRVVSATTDDSYTWGAHVHIKGTASVQIDNAEFVGTGQISSTAEANRYSIFFDNSGNMPGSYVVGSSFHDTMRGAVGLAKTSYMNIKDNVAFNCSGNTFVVLGAGVSEGNVFEHNWATYGRTNDNWGNAASSFVLGYMNNTWIQNAASGASIGYLITLPSDNNAAATLYGSDFWPRFVQLGVFSNNYAHSMARDGLNFGSWSPRYWTMSSVRSLNDTLSVSAIGSIVSNRPFSSAIISDTHVYKCGQSGLWSDAQLVQYQRFHFSDNRYGIGFTGVGLLFENSVIVGDSPNTGTPSVPDYEQGRSRPNPYSPEDSIFGVIFPSCCEPAFFVNIRFYNYNDDVFKFVNLVRLAGAVGVDSGSGSTSTDHRFFKAGFASVQRRLLLDPEYTNDAVKSFSLTDIDGSFTTDVTGGGCGAVIVSAAPTLYSSACGFQSEWNAYLCPATDGYPAYRRITIEDLSDTIVPNITRAQSAGILRRLVDGSSTALDANSQTNGYILEYDTNVVVNTEYLLEFGTVGETPDNVRLNFFDYMDGNFYTGQGPEWIRIAFPYPTNANFTVTISNRALTSGTSRAQVSSSTYFWDQPNGLLWVGLGGDRDNFAYYNKIPFPATGRSLTIVADCPTGCTVTNPAVPSSTSSPGAPTFRRCLANGDGYLGWANGIPNFTPAGAAVDIFVDSLAVGWSSNDKTYLLTDALPFTPSVPITGVSIWFNWTNYQSTGFYSNNGPTVGSNTHISFTIRSDPAGGIDGVWELDGFICLYNEDDTQGCVDLNNPWYSPSGPVSSDAWYSIYVPIADFGTAFGATNKINQVRFGHNQARTVSVYVDDVRLGAYTVTFLASPQPVTNAAAATTSSTGGGGRSKAPVGAIVGGVIGGIVALAIIVGLIVFLVMKGGFSGMKEFAARTTRNQPRWAA